MKKSKIVLAVASAFLLAACSGKKVDKVKPSDLPKSGAKTFVTSPTGAMEAFGNLAYSFEDNEAVYEIGEYLSEYVDFVEENSEKIGTSKFAVKLSDAVEKLETDVESFGKDLAAGKASLKFDASVGKADGLPEGLSVNLSKLKFDLDAKLDSGDNPKGSIKGSGSAKADVKIKDLELAVEKLDAKCDISAKANGNTANGDVNFSVSASASGKMPGLSLDAKNFGINLKAKKIDIGLADYSAKGNVEASASGEIKLVFDYDKFKKNIKDADAKTLDKFPVKGLIVNLKSSSFEKISAKEKVTLANPGNLTVDADEYFGFSTGLSFCNPDGVGGIFITEFFCSFDAKVNVSELTTKFEELLSTEAKLSEKEFKNKKLPMEAKVKVAFYDDNGKETYCVVEAKNLYEVYSLIYDNREIIGSFAEEFLDTYTDALLSGVGSYYDSYSYAYDDDDDYDYDDDDYLYSDLGKAYSDAYDEFSNAYSDAYDELSDAYSDAYDELDDALGVYGDVLDAYGDIYGDSLDAVNGALDLYGSLY